ncbi:related to RNA exonuclease 3 [Ramularia collo-cygni]|uniref:Related to RNA exonuclease 3 n=1 Tax=Ramularia collo-cygni TaxID=112498 RepID=A0A2D3VCC9_9PEZI|nr:related to RNA exonuclease 3 [Ramularia collo-cygni]CZT22642.1 related to RNA exonuclease 3 [Ramularia collo-cygni]
MLFSTTNLFKGIACPAGANCKLTHCIYSHDAPELAATQPPPAAVVPAPPPPSNDVVEPAAKRRKITYNTLADKPLSRADMIRSQLAAVRPSASSSSSSSHSSTSSTLLHPPRTLVKPVSPPQTSKAVAASGKVASSAAPPSSSAVKIETLNPRLIPNDPVGHAKRSLFIKHLHAEMVRLNKQVGDAGGLEGVMFLPEQELIKLALDEEEKVVREQPKVYPNIIKQRISTLKKISTEDWTKQVQAIRTKDSTMPKKKNKSSEEKVINTGLELEQEILILPHLVVTDQSTLQPHGYIPTPPTPREASIAAEAVEASRNYEECDRCAARFQVFPDRNSETGLLTGGGICKFHPNRPIQPPKANKGEALKAKVHPCCNETIGTPGCAENEEHVFKTTSPARLAAVCPFIVTPENPTPRRSPLNGKEIKAVVFDCEMGYTSLGLELIRLTALSWPEHEELVDVLVRPLGAIIDLNSRFSGVYPEDYSNGKIPVVEGPAKARHLMCEYLTPSTPLMGHAIDNDLNTVRLCHPTIVDTVLLFAHSKGLPMRLGLRMLSQRYLGRAIQSGVGGHDSKEDAIATGDLVRWKVGEKWKALRVEGWKIDEGGLVRPDGDGVEDPAWAEGGGKRKLADLLEDVGEGSSGGGGGGGGDVGEEGVAK